MDPFCFNHRLEGTEALGSDAKFAEENVIGDCEHIELHDHVCEIHWCVDFLFVPCLDFFDSHSFTLCENQLQGEVTIHLLHHSDWFCFTESERAVVAGGVHAGPKQDAIVHVGRVPSGEADHVETAAFELKI